MTSLEFTAAIAALAILLFVTLGAQFHWFGRGRFQAIVIFVSGVAAIVALRIGGIPPAWFEGGIPAFALALTLIVSAFLGRRDEPTFRLPLFCGMGLTLLIANVVQAAKNVL